jgi:hypothetical protein
MSICGKETFLFSQPRTQYGKGLEALKTHAVLALPEIQPYLKSQDSTHEANVRLQAILGPGYVRLPILRAVARALKRWFPDLQSCPRAFLRVWAGCVYYLIKNLAFLYAAKERGLIQELLNATPAPGSSETEISSPSDWECGSTENPAPNPVITFIPSDPSRFRLPGIREILPDDVPLWPLFA